MIQWTAEKLRALGTEIEIADIGIETLPNGQELPLPNVILGNLGKVSYIICDCVLIDWLI